MGVGVYVCGWHLSFILYWLVAVKPGLRQQNFWHYLSNSIILSASEFEEVPKLQCAQLMHWRAWIFYLLKQMLIYPAADLHLVDWEMRSCILMMWLRNKIAYFPSRTSTWDAILCFMWFIMCQVLVRTSWVFLFVIRGYWGLQKTRKQTEYLKWFCLYQCIFACACCK